jgi:hypothetical protein
LAIVYQASDLLLQFWIKAPTGNWSALGIERTHVQLRSTLMIVGEIAALIGAISSAATTITLVVKEIRSAKAKPPSVPDKQRPGRFCRI